MTPETSAVPQATDGTVKVNGAELCGQGCPGIGETPELCGDP